MRNAILIGNNHIVTTDNSGGIGEKQADIVHTTDRLTAYFSTRVCLLEQWAAHAMPTTVLLHNFSGSASWHNYVAGIEDVFTETSMPPPPISGSSETNISLSQSAIAITMIGQQQERITSKDCEWYTYGYPLVGDEVLQNPEKIASLQKLNQALKEGCIQQLWPVGSRGILHEIRILTKTSTAEITTHLDIHKSAGPSTVVLLSIPKDKQQRANDLFKEHLHKVVINY